MIQPTISIIIPTYNSARTLSECLSSINSQKYPNGKIDLIIVDGGSTDTTLEIARKFNGNILKNPHITHPKGRPIGITASSGDLILCLDSDNILPQGFLEKIIIPFKDPEIIATEPLYYLSKKKNTLLDRYCSLVGGDDPIAIYMGYYDRFSFLSNTWTGMPIKQEDKGDYYKFKLLSNENMPPLGANGFIVRSKYLKKINYDPFYHVKIVRDLLNYFKDSFLAKSKIGIYHKHSDSLNKFLLKKIRRGKRRFDPKNKNLNLPLATSSKKNILIIKLLLFFPIIFDTLKGYKRKKSLVWFIHPLMVYLTFFAYVYSFITSFFISKNQLYERV